MSHGKKGQQSLSLDDFRKMSSKDPDAVEVGTRAKESGDQLEDWIADHSRRYLPDVDLVHVPARFEVWRPPNRATDLLRILRSLYGKLMKWNRLFFAKPSKVTWVDFIALLPDGGCAHFDAKVTGTDTGSWSFASEQRPVLKVHQLAMLNRRASRGEPCFIYLRHAPNELTYTDYIIPYFPNHGLPITTKTSVAFSKLEKWAIPKNSRQFCWLDACCTPQRWADYCAGGWAGLAEIPETFVEAFAHKRNIIFGQPSKPVEPPKDRTV